jgi:hypothetical protein
MKKMNPALVRGVSAATLAAFLWAGVPAPARAALIGTDVAVGEALYAGSRSAHLAKVEAALARADVQGQLQKLGVAPADARLRVAALTDAELAQLAGHIDALPAGGDGGLLAVIGVLFVVLLILDYLDVVNVFHHRR